MIAPPAKTKVEAWAPKHQCLITQVGAANVWNMTPGSRRAAPGAGGVKGPAAAAGGGTDGQAPCVNNTFANNTFANNTFC